MKRAILVHGNPGRAAVLAPLEAVLVQRGFRVHAVELPMQDASPIERPIVDAAAGDPAVLVGYSYGAYLALRAAARARVAGVCLVNPHLVAREGLALPLKLLLSVPGLGRKLVGRGLEARVDESLGRWFGKAAPPPALRAALCDADLWLRAARWKDLQAREPLPALAARDLPALRVLVGEEDVGSPWRDQAGVIADLAPEALRRVPGAAHALPWTHADLVADVVCELVA